MGNMARNKGQRGERELCDLLARELALPDGVRRNLEQVRSGGADIMEIAGYAFEVKRVEVLAVNTWWQQALRQAGARTPVLAYRQNRKQWHFCIPASTLGIDDPGYLTVDKNIFFKWLQLC